MPRKEELPVWLHVAELEARCMEAWRKAISPSLTQERFMCERVAAVETTVSRRPGGHISMTIVLVPRRKGDGQVEYFRLQRTGNKLYQQVEPASTSS